MIKLIVQQYNSDLMLTLPEDTPAEDPRMIELTLLGNLVADYDEEHYPISKPTLVDVMKLRMYEMGLTQKALSQVIKSNMIIVTAKRRL